MVAVHEAGHAIALLAQGVPFAQASIKPNKDSAGHVRHDTPLLFEVRVRRQVARAMIVCSYAGFEAESMAYPDADPAFCSEDRDNAFELSREYLVLPRGCSFVGDGAHHEYLDGLRKEARRLVRKHWTSVDAFAGLLLKNTTVPYDVAQRFWNTR